MDLNAPLGMTPRPVPKRGAGMLVALGLGAVALAGGLFWAFSDPRSGEPKAIALVPPENQPAAQRNSDLASAGLSPNELGVGRGPNNSIDRTPTGSLHNGRGDDSASLEHGVKVFRSAQPASPTPSAQTGPLIIDVSRALDDPLRKTTGGAVRSQSTGQAQAQSTAELPKVAIFVSGMGLDESATRTAIEVMPSAVSLAFLPYGTALVGLVEAAKTRGHEVLLQLPMQDKASGKAGVQRPHSLTIDRDEAATNADLDWLLAGVQGYDGVTNLLGASVSSDTATMTAILKAVGGRHLFYLDDGTSTRSVAVSIGTNLGVPTRQADIVLDATSDPALVRANLEALVALARSKGSAIGMASGLPDHIAAIARFAGELRGQGIDLVPVNTLAGGTTVPPIASSAR